MFREMRRKAQQLSYEKTEEILQNATSGVLAVSGDDGYPYAVPMSYVYHDGKVYFHSAKTGHKLDGIERNSRVSFCVIDMDEVLPEKYTTCYRSAIVFGKARVITDESEMRKAAVLLADKYAPGDVSGSKAEIDGGIGRMYMIELTVEHMTGKQAKELL